MGADPGAVSRNAMQVQPLHSAAAGSHREAVQTLLDGGGDVNARTRGGFTAVHDAAQNGDMDVVRLLVERGADATLADDRGRRPADLAEERGHVDVATLLRAG